MSSYIGTVNPYDMGHPSTYFKRKGHSPLIRDLPDLVGMSLKPTDKDDENSTKRRMLGLVNRGTIAHVLNLHLESTGLLTVPTPLTHINGKKGFLWDLERASSKYRLAQIFGIGKETCNWKACASWKEFLRTTVETTKNNFRSVSFTNAFKNILKWLQWGPLIEHFGSIGRWLIKGRGFFSALFGTAVLGLAGYKAIRDTVEQKSLFAGLKSISTFVVSYQAGSLAFGIAAALCPVSNLFLSSIVGLAAAGYVGAKVGNAMNTLWDSLLGKKSASKNPKQQEPPKEPEPYDGIRELLAQRQKQAGQNPFQSPFGPSTNLSFYGDKAEAV